MARKLSQGSELGNLKSFPVCFLLAIIPHFLRVSVESLCPVGPVWAPCFSHLVVHVRNWGLPLAHSLPDFTYQIIESFKFNTFLTYSIATIFIQALTHFLPATEVVFRAS